jgi:NADH-quinone oxidoreductase E subunit
MKEVAPYMPELTEKYAKLEQSIAAHREEKGALMPVLQEAQELFGCVPMDVQQIIADGLGTTLSDVYGVTTFYSQFSLQPKGQYVVGVCLGTACYVKGSAKVLDKVMDELKIRVGKTTPDGKFTLQSTRCLGACGLAPVMMINDEVYGRLTPDEIPAILEKYKA